MMKTFVIYHKPHNSFRGRIALWKQLSKSWKYGFVLRIGHCGMAIRFGKIK